MHPLFALTLLQGLEYDGKGLYLDILEVKQNLSLTVLASANQETDQTEHLQSSAGAPVYQVLLQKNSSRHSISDLFVLLFLLQADRCDLSTLFIVQ